MNYLSPDHLIIYASLLITLVVGYWSGRGIKDIRNYAIANKMYGTGTLVLTYMATNFAGAGLINDTAQVFANGIIMAVARVGLILLYVLLGLFIVPKAANFGHCITMGDLMEHFYDKYGKIIAGILGLLTSLCIASMEMIVLGIIFESLLGIKASWGVAIGGLVLTIYSAHGGIKAVTTTDVLQFAILIVVIPITATMAVGHVGGIQELFTKVPTVKFEIFNHERFSYYATLFLMWTILPAGLIDPAIIQRLLMAKRPSQIRKQYLIIAALDPSLNIILMLIGLAGLVLYPTIEATQVFPHIVQELLPVGIKGLAIAGVLAVSMSTIDSYLHASGLTFTHDVLKPICDSRKVAINELSWAQYSTLAIGIVAIGIGIAGAGATTDEILNYAFTSLGFTGPILMFPLLSGIMGLKTDKRSFYTALPITILVYVIATIYLPATHSHLSLPISILANGIVFFGMHIVQNKGFSIVQQMQYVEIDRVWRPKWGRFFQQLALYIPTPSNIVHYSQQRVIKYGAPYLIFGIFCCVSFIVPYFMWSPIAHQSYSIMLPLRLVGAFLCVLLLFEEKWPSTLKPYMPTFWHATVLYCIPFTTTVMFLLAQGSVEWLVNVTMSIMFMIVLVDWISFFILMGAGVSLGVLFYTQVVGTVHLTLDFTNVYLLVYQVFFATLIGLIFARRKEQNFLEKLQISQLLGDTVSQEAKRTLWSLDQLAHVVDGHVRMYAQQAQELQEQGKVEEGQVKLTIKPDTIEYIGNLMFASLAVIRQSEQALDILTSALKAKVIAPHLEPCAIGPCVSISIEECFFQQEPYLLEADLRQDFKAKISPLHFQYVVLCLLRYICSYPDRGAIKVNLTPGSLQIKAYGINLAPSVAVALFTLDSEVGQRENANLDMTICKLIMEALEGRILCKSGQLEGASYLEFVLKLPSM